MRDALTIIALAGFAASAAADGNYPAKKLRGWEEEQHWPGPGVTATFNGRETSVQFKDRNSLTVYMSDPVEFEHRIAPQLIVKCYLDKGLTLDLNAPTPGDACGRLLDSKEEDGYTFLRFELYNARKEFSQLTFHTSAKEGQLIISGMQLIEAPYAPHRLPAQELTFPRKEFEKTELTSLKVPADAKDWPARREELHKLWLTALGPMPAARPPLVAKELSSEEFEDYTRKKVRFASEGGDTLDAWLLLPKTQDGSKGPFPAVVCLHPTTQVRSDEMVGLAGRGTHAHAIQLVKEGYVTLAYDCYIMKADTAEGSQIKQQVKALADRVPQWTGLGKMTWDASRAVDYLETLPVVDKKRIGVIGHSLGAKEALFAAAFEPRFACAVASEGGVGLTFSNWTDAWYLGEKMKPRIGELENHQVLALVAPRPILILGGDSADGAKSRPFIDEAGAVYRLLGAPEGVALYNHKAGHAFPPAAASVAYRWLETHLKKK